MWLEGYLKDHKKRLLEEKVLKYKCNDCDKAFTIISHWSSLLMHTNKIQNSNINVKHVIMLLTQASHLTLHQRDVHEGLQYPCDNCGKEFTQKTHVRTHKNIVHMLGERAV